MAYHSTPPPLWATGPRLSRQFYIVQGRHTRRFVDGYRRLVDVYRRLVDVYRRFVDGYRRPVDVYRRFVDGYR
jgi:hypothetical protein